jgi:hypothetical protein
MGVFANDVRYGKILGPNQRGFNRARWHSQLNQPGMDADDIRLLNAGLFFDDLLSYLRDEKKISEIGLTPYAIIRLTVALATFNLFQLLEAANNKLPKRAPQKTVLMSDLIEQTVELASGQRFTPDELLTGAGDGLKHMLRELLTANKSATQLAEDQADEKSLHEINQEFNKAILYQCAAEYWNDCVGNGYGIVSIGEDVKLLPFDKEIEIARTVSTYRRQNVTLQHQSALVEFWDNKLSQDEKKHLCQLKLVNRVSGRERIERIELGMKAKSLSANARAFAEKFSIRDGYYKHLLDEGLPKFKNISLKQVLDGWLVLHSLSLVIYDSFKALAELDAKGLLQYAPRIPARVLTSTFSKALSLTTDQATNLVNVFVFDPNSNCEVWTQPLVRLGHDFCLVIPCIHSVQLLRLAEGWMRQGGLDLNRKGPEFEKFCVDELKESIGQSPIKSSVILLDRSFRFSPPGENMEEIDIVIIVNKVVLLVEAKCILWPDDALQFSNYRDKVEQAVEQVVRKKHAAERNANEFAKKVRQLGFHLEPEFTVVACVLSNSAIYSGFPISGVAIVDLPILKAFFLNEHTKFESRQAGNVVRQHKISFYSDASEAEQVLSSYLLDPPQLSDTKASVKSRELVFPVAVGESGQLIQELYSVELDADEMLKRYGLASELGSSSVSDA